MNEVLEIRVLKKAQHSMSPSALGALLAEDEMACGLPMLVDNAADAVRLLGLRGSQVSSLEAALSRGGLWKGIANRGLLVAEGENVCVRLAAQSAAA
ncbi:hypothetical protein I6F15_04480 [Bradyrhizobium sp. BRP14]|nr:hypothetical protein [Bradyrhizobium sp. BRP14]